MRSVVEVGDGFVELEVGLHRIEAFPVVVVSASVPYKDVLPFVRYRIGIGDFLHFVFVGVLRVDDMRNGHGYESDGAEKCSKHLIPF